MVQMKECVCVCVFFLGGGVGGEGISCNFILESLDMVALGRCIYESGGPVAQSIVNLMKL